MILDPERSLLWWLIKDVLKLTMFLCVEVRFTVILFPPPIPVISTDDILFSTVRWCSIVHYYLPFTNYYWSCVHVFVGCWSPYLVEQLGIRLPQYTFRHSYIVTERMDGVVNMPNIRDHELSIYLKVQGDVLHIGGYEPNPVILDEGVSWQSILGVLLY